jgi:nucleotide-binding universal stress UspA family protein
MPFRSESALPTALFATAAETFPVASLRCAQTFADLLGAELHVLRVLATPTSLPGLRNSLDAFAGPDVLARFVDAARDTSRECAAALSERFVDERVHMQVGDLFEAATEQADDLGAALLMVPGSEASGPQITALVRHSGLPVLVVRPTPVGTAIVAATALIDLRYPVLQRAAELGRRFQTRLIAVHTVRDHTRRRPPGFASSAAQRQQRLEVIRARLAHATKALASSADPILALGPDPVDAILREARACDARLVVVGTSRRSRLRRALRPSVAARLIDRAARSVLVTPIGDSVARGI